LHNAEKKRKDKIPFGKAFTVYRGIGLDASNIDEYKKMVGDRNGINLRGFTSTSLDREVSN